MSATPRLLVVSGNPGLAMLLGRHGYDVDDCRPTSAWVASAQVADGVLLDLGSVGATEQALSSMAAPSSRVLVVGQDGAGWNELAVLAGAPLVRLPLAADDLLRQLRMLLQAAAARRTVPAGVSTGQVDHVVDLDAGSSSAAVATPPSARPDSNDLGPPGLPPQLPSQPTPEGRRRRPGGHTQARVEGVADLVGRLLGRLDELTCLTDVATAVLDDAVERCGADAGALLVRDGDRWTVQAGHALRPLEERLEVADDAWVVDRVVRQGLGLLVAGSDIVRQRLVGVPVTSWQNLAAAPVGGRRALLLLGSAGRTFDEADLARLMDVDEEATALIDQALDLRALARALAPHTDGELSP